jgi:hypothetical protein
VRDHDFTRLLHPIAYASRTVDIAFCERTQRIQRHDVPPILARTFLPHRPTAQVISCCSLSMMGCITG